MSDADDGNWVSDVESAVPLTLTAHQPLYDNGVLTVNISWSAGQSRHSTLPPSQPFNIHSEDTTNLHEMTTRQNRQAQQ